MCKFWAAKASLSVIGLLLLGLCILPDIATAAVPCTPTERQGVKVRVAVAGVDCITGREIVDVFYERLDGGYPNPEKTVNGFRCAAVLASTELTCEKYSRWILASSQPTDHPAQWHPAPPHKVRLGHRKARLSARVARTAAAEFLGRRYGEAWYSRAGGRVNCNRRLSFSRRKCFIAFVIGDTGWYGAVRVSYFERGPRSEGNRDARIRFRITRLDEYCAFVEHGSRSECTHMERGYAHLRFF